MTGPDYWHKQTKAQPLFPNLIWSRPESQQARGKLAIVGGNLYSFAASAKAYTQAMNAGAGSVRVALPDAVQKQLPAGSLGFDLDFLPSTPSGSFSQMALNDLLALGEWADGIVLAGELGRNSETAILLEKFIEKYNSQLTITGDSLDYFTNNSAILERASTVIVPSLTQLQKLAMAARLTQPITSNLGLYQLVEAVHELTVSHKANLIYSLEDNTLVAADGKVSTTAIDNPDALDIAVRAAVWWLQFPTQSFEALTSSLARE